MQPIQRSDNRASSRLAPVLLSVLLLAAACVIPGTQTVTIAPAQPYHVENEVTVQASSDITWDRLVQGLSRGFYVINNIDKASRLINISFSSDSPQEYIDCGTTSRTYSRGQDEERYVYLVAESSSYKLGEKRSGTIVTYEVNRATELEGRANIYVAPADSGATTVMVNVRYILTITLTGTYQSESPIGIKSSKTPMTPQATTIAFNTNQPNSTDIGTPDNPTSVTCYSRGRLEGEIIRFAKPE